MTDNSILNMVGGEKHINPHYDIKEESSNKGFTGIEVNGVRFSNIQEMLVYMDKQRNEIILLEKENEELKERADKADLDSVTFFNQLCKAKEIIKDFLSLGIFGIFKGTTAEEIVDKAEDFLKEDK